MFWLLTFALLAMDQVCRAVFSGRRRDGVPCGVWCVVVRCVVVCGVVWCVVLRCVVVCGVAWCGVVSCDVACRVLCCGVWRCLLCGVWYAVVWCAVVCG